MHVRKLPRVLRFLAVVTGGKAHRFLLEFASFAVFQVHGVQAMRPCVHLVIRHVTIELIGRDVNLLKLGIGLLNVRQVLRPVCLREFEDKK